jgi:hypothetical protein
MVAVVGREERRVQANHANREIVARFDCGRPEQSRVVLSASARLVQVTCESEVVTHSLRKAKTVGGVSERFVQRLAGSQTPEQACDVSGLVCFPLNVVISRNSVDALEIQSQSMRHCREPLERLRILRRDCGRRSHARAAAETDIASRKDRAKTPHTSVQANHVVAESLRDQLLVHSVTLIPVAKVHVGDVEPGIEGLEVGTHFEVSAIARA